MTVLHAPSEGSETAKRILDAAGPAFAESGFKSTTVREICRAAGVNLASVNYHFGDKKRLYIEVIKHAHRSRAEQVPLPDWPPGTPPQQKLRDFIHTILMRMIGVEDEPWQARLMMREILQPTAAAQQLVQQYFRPHLEKLLSILDEMLPGETPLARRHQLAFSVIGQCLFYRFNRRIIHLLISPDELKRHYGPHQLADHISDVTLAALSEGRLFDRFPLHDEAAGERDEHSSFTRN